MMCSILDIALSSDVNGNKDGPKLHVLLVIFVLFPLNDEKRFSRNFLKTQL